MALFGGGFAPLCVTTVVSVALARDNGCERVRVSLDLVLSVVLSSALDCCDAADSAAAAAATAAAAAAANNWQLLAATGGKLFVRPKQLQAFERSATTALLLARIQQRHFFLRWPSQAPPVTKPTNK